MAKIKIPLALQLLRENGSMTSREFARLFFPDSIEWAKKNDRRVVWAAMNYLRRLKKRGLVRCVHRRGALDHWVVVEIGAAADR